MSDDNDLEDNLEILEEMKLRGGRIFKKRFKFVKKALSFFEFSDERKKRKENVIELVQMINEELAKLGESIAELRILPRRIRDLRWEPTHENIQRKPLEKVNDLHSKLLDALTETINKYEKYRNDGRKQLKELLEKEMK